MSMFYELMMRKKEQIMYATIKGSLTENDGVFSGFDYNNYLATQEVLDTSKDFEICIKANTGTMTGSFRAIFRNTFGLNPGNVGFAVGLVGNVDNKKTSTYIIDSSGNQIVNGQVGITYFHNDTDYYFKFSQKINNNTYTIKLESSTNGINWTTENSWTHNLPIRNSGQGVAFGGGNLNQPTQFWSGSIDLPNSYIKLGSTKYKIVAVPEE